MFRPADQHIRGKADGLQLLDRMLGGFGFQLSTGRKIGQQRQVHQDRLAARAFVNELTDRFKERQAFDIADRAADFAQHEINLIIADAQEVFDFIGDVGDNLNGLAQVIAAPFLFQHVGIDAARGNAVGLARRHPGEAFVMAKVKIGFRAIVGDEHFAMFKRAHRAGIDVQIGVQFAQADGIATGLQQRTKGSRCKALAKRGHHAAGDEDIACHAVGPP